MSSVLWTALLREPLHAVTAQLWNVFSVHGSSSKPVCPCSSWAYTLNCATERFVFVCLLKKNTSIVNSCNKVQCDRSHRFEKKICYSLRKAEWFRRTALLWKASRWTPRSIQIPMWLPLTSPHFPQPSQCVFIPNPQLLYSTYFMAFCWGLNKGCFGSHLGSCAGARVPAALHQRQAWTQSGHVFSAKGPDGISGPLSLSGLVPWNLPSWKQGARRTPSAVPCHMPGRPSVDSLSGYCEEDPVPKRHGNSGICSMFFFFFKKVTSANGHLKEPWIRALYQMSARHLYLWLPSNKDELLRGVEVDLKNIGCFFS